MENKYDIKFKFLERIEELKYQRSIIIPFFNDKFVMSFDPIKKCWKFPMGQSDENENILQSSIRQTFEECGAISEYLKPIGVYEDIYLIYISKIAIFEPKPRWSDADLVKLFEKLPSKILDEDKLLYETILKEIKAKCICI